MLLGAGVERHQLMQNFQPSAEWMSDLNEWEKRQVDEWVAQRKSETLQELARDVICQALIAHQPSTNLFYLVPHVFDQGILPLPDVFKDFFLHNTKL